MSFKAFAFASATYSLLSTPIDRIKTVRQTQNVYLPASKRYDSELQVAQHIFHTQGLSAFWRGNLVQLVGIAPLWAASPLTQYAAIWFSHLDIVLNLCSYDVRRTLLGGVNAFLLGLVAHPLLVVRTLMGLDMHPQPLIERGSMFACVRDILATDGLTGFWNGYATLTLRDVLYRSALDVLLSRFDDHVINLVDLDLVPQFLVFSVLSTVATLVTYPLNTIGFRLLAQTTQNKRKYSGALHCAAVTWREEGFLGFYKGGWVNLARMPLLSMVGFALSYLESGSIN